MKTTTICKISDKLIKKHLLAWFSIATTEQIQHGLEWYKSAQSFVQAISEKYDISSYKVAGVVSALSPNNKWYQNKKDTVTVIEAYLADVDSSEIKVCTYNANKYKAFRILKGSANITEKSPKTHAFAMNVGLLSSDHITIDKWHIRACLCTINTKPSSDIQQSIAINQYRRVERITAELARDLDIKGFELQAIIWCAIREKWGIIK